MTKRLPVTDHAVIRYLERVAAIDVEAVRRRIFDHTKQALGAGASGTISNGIRYRMRNGVVTSVWVEQCHSRPLDWPQADNDQDGAE